MYWSKICVVFEALGFSLSPGCES